MPGWSALGWLAVLALTAQVLGWLLISSSLPRLPAALTSVLLLAQPVGALLVSAVLLAEAPTTVQYAGTALILAGVVVATATRPTSSPPAPVVPTSPTPRAQAASLDAMTGGRTS